MGRVRVTVRCQDDGLSLGDVAGDNGIRDEGTLLEKSSMEGSSTGVDITSSEVQAAVLRESLLSLLLDWLRCTGLDGSDDIREAERNSSHHGGSSDQGNDESGDLHFSDVFFSGVVSVASCRKIVMLKDERSWLDVLHQRARDCGCWGETFKRASRWSYIHG